MPSTLRDDHQHPLKVANASLRQAAADATERDEPALARDLTEMADRLGDLLTQPAANTISKPRTPRTRTDNAQEAQS